MSSSAGILRAGVVARQLSQQVRLRSLFDVIPTNMTLPLQSTRNRIRAKQRLSAFDLLESGKYILANALENDPGVTTTISQTKADAQEASLAGIKQQRHSLFDALHADEKAMKHPQKYPVLAQIIDPNTKAQEVSRVRKNHNALPHLKQLRSIESQMSASKSALICEVSNFDNRNTEGKTVLSIQSSDMAGESLPLTPRMQWQMQDLHQMSSKLAPSSPFSFTESKTHEDAKEREKVFRKAKELMTGLEQAVQQRNIRPFGKHGPAASALLGNVMRFFSVSHHKTANQSVFDECRRVLAFLDYLNLDRQETHYQYSILVAVQEQRWQEAADLFLQQIDREVSGFCPVKVCVSSPVGMYAIARARQDDGAAAVDLVFDAVTSLSLISPTEQEKHILAAGVALGLAGDWKGLVSYQENCVNASLMGQPLVAATMHSCILCNQPDAALKVFQTLLGGHFAISSEFHWGGGKHQVAPLCRDLAMRACGNSGHSGNSAQALDLLTLALQGDLAISAEALEGVLNACERDVKWKDAMGVFYQCINTDSKIWIVPGASLHIPTIGDLAERNRLEVDRALVYRGKIVSSVMRACNAANQCGTALLCHILADLSPPGPVFYGEETAHITGDEPEIAGYIEQTLFPLLAEVSNPDELISASIVAMGGLSCFEQARILINATNKGIGDEVDLHDASSIQLNAHSSADASTTEQGGWNNAHRQVYRLCTALNEIKRKRERLTCYQLQLLSSVFASALRCCTNCGQAEVGIQLGEYIQSELSCLAASLDANHFAFARKIQNLSEYALILDDTLLAEKMKALHSANQGHAALSLFELNVNVEDQRISEWSQSCNMATKLLSQNEENERALMLCQRVAKSTSSSESFVAAANAFVEADRWSDAADIYNLALEKGCLSTGLCLKAMKAVIEMNMPGRLRVLRAIAHDAGRPVGQSRVEWLNSNYWKIKQSLGFAHARLLMRWNDPANSYLDELHFALDVFKERLAHGLQAKKVSLHVIVSHARHFREGDIQSDKRGIVRVPCDRQSWMEVMERVLQMSSSLKNDVHFIDECSMALRNLGCNAACVNFVQRAIECGITLPPRALKEALLAVQAMGIEDK